MSRYLLVTSFVLTIFSLTLWSQPISAQVDEPVENTPETIEEPLIFDDIANHWSYHVVKWLAGNNPQQISYLDVSEGRFRPGCPISRTEWAVMSMTILDLKNRPDAEENRVAKAPRCPDIPSWPCPFSDVQATASSNPPELNSDYYPTFHAWRTGLISGYKDGTFQGDRSLTYAEAIASLAGVLDLVAQIETLQQQNGEDPSIIGTDYFMNGIVMEDKWFAPALHGALLANLVALDWPLEFYPNRPPLSRGEAAVMMYLTLAYQGKASLDDPILGQQVGSDPRENALRHIRKAGERDFSFGPPAVRRQCND